MQRVRQKAHVAVIAPSAHLTDLTSLLSDWRINHVIVGDELDRGVFVTAQKLLTGDIFGIEKYLPEGTPVHYLRLRDFEGRGQRHRHGARVRRGRRSMRRQVRNRHRLRSARSC